MSVAVPQRRDFVPGAERHTARVTKFKTLGTPADRIVQFLASDGTVDRMGDTIAPEGWDCVAYKRNPVILYAHDNSGRVPVGQGVKVWGDEAGLHVQIKFDQDPEADLVFKKVCAGTLRAVSVGFRPLEYEWRAPDEELGDHGGIDFTRQELLEISIVPVPANANALAEERTKAMKTAPAAVAAPVAPDVSEELKNLLNLVTGIATEIEELKAADPSKPDRPFAKALDKIEGLTSEQKAEIVKASEQSHEMHPDVAKCVGAAHKALTKALTMHNGAASGGKPAPGDDDDEEDEKSLADLLVKQAELDAELKNLTGRVA